MPAETGYPDDRPFPGQQMFVQFSVGLGNSRINIEQYLPLGEDTQQSLAHIQALIITPGLAMAHTLLAAHFQQLVYALGETGEA
jgi:hypothetical protein